MDQTEYVNVNFWAIIDFEIRLTDPLLLLGACFQMGPTFGGMMGSGVKAAHEALRILKSHRVVDGKVVGTA